MRNGCHQAAPRAVATISSSENSGAGPHRRHVRRRCWAALQRAGPAPRRKYLADVEFVEVLAGLKDSLLVRNGCNAAPSRDALKAPRDFNSRPAPTVALESL
jgi:hypothetical protein